MEPDCDPLCLPQVSLCTPSENTPTESLARLVAMVFQWFHSTAYMMDDEVGSLVEKLKPQFVTKWLKTVCDVRFDVMVMCLLPKPMEFARVSGGHPSGPAVGEDLGRNATFDLPSVCVNSQRQLAYLGVVASTCNPRL